MASELPNGTYPPHQGYGSLDSQQNGYAYGTNGSQSSQATAIHHNPPASSTPAAPSSSGPSSSPPQSDEVGWYFVEQYYTTLSRNPEKLYLFYNKRSQYVSGQETDKVSVCVGQRAIHERIKSLEFQDCKVRVTNVDSQGSDSNIVIQVIGEISNKSQPHKKFTQTFVLAPQEKGFFVLNDIFRYLVDEEDEPEQAAEAEAPEVESGATAKSGYLEPTPTVEPTPDTLTSSTTPAAVEHDAQQVDEGLKSKVPEEQITEPEQPKTNGHPEVEEEIKEAEEPAAATPSVEEPATAEPEIPAPAEVQPEPVKQVATPEPTPSPPKQATPQPAPAPNPAAPKTWASLAASANKVATPAAPSPASSSTSQNKPAPKPTAAAPSTSSAASAPKPAPSAPAAQREASPAEGSTNDEWTAVGGNHNRNQSRQANTTQPPEPQWRGYIKNVHEGVDGNALKAHLETYGKLLYFDIARQKNCAFVDFETEEGYNAAIQANPHNMSDEALYVEKRKFHPGATPYIPRGRGRGGPGQGPPRGGFQGRGGYAPRGGRGGGPGGAPRGRGSSVAT